MKRLFVSAFLSAICVISLAQNLRSVQGRVVNEDGAPLPEATISVEGYTATFITDANGDFSAEIPYGYNYLTANLEDYISKTVEVDGSYLVIKLTYDREAFKRIRKATAAEEAARIKEEKNSRAASYDAKYKNRGLSHAVDVSYFPEIIGGEMIYRYSGYREYNSFHPVEITYALSYKFNRSLALGLGVGVLFNLKSFTIINDEFVFNDDSHDGFMEHQLDVPVFINFRAWFCRTIVRPFINANIGYHCLSGTLLCDAAIGCELRLSKTVGLHFLAGASITPVPDFMSGGFSKSSGISLSSFTNNGYCGILTPSIKLGLDF